MFLISWGIPQSSPLLLTYTTSWSKFWPCPKRLWNWFKVKLPTIWTDGKAEDSRGGKSQRKEEKKRKDQRRERVRRKKMQMREKVEKSRNAVFFQWSAAPKGRKGGSLKRRVRSQLAKWEMKNCMPLWREAHLEVKSVKTWQCRTIFGS